MFTWAWTFHNFTLISVQNIYKDRTKMVKKTAIRKKESMHHPYFSDVVNNKHGSESKMSKQTEAWVSLLYYTILNDDDDDL